MEQYDSEWFAALVNDCNVQPRFTEMSRRYQAVGPGELVASQCGAVSWHAQLDTRLWVRLSMSRCRRHDVCNSD